MDMDTNNDSDQTSQSSEYNLSYHSTEQETPVTKPGKSLWSNYAPLYKHRLYNDILKTSDMKGVVTNLVNSYALDRDKVLKDVLQLFLDVASYQHIKLDSYLEHHELTDVVAHMENSPSSALKSTGRYLLHIRQKAFVAKHVRIEDFVVVLIYICATENILYDFHLIAKCVTFLKDMGSSRIRAIRHTGVYLALKFQSGFIRQASKITKKMQQYQDQMQQATNTEIANKLERKLLNQQNKYEQINKLIDFLHKNVYVENCFMLDSQLFSMRQDCIGEIMNWIEYFPERYLQNNCIVYISRALTDPNKIVRYFALQCLSSIFQKYHVQLQPKSEKYVAIIAERIKDADYKVAILAVDSLIGMSRYTKIRNCVRDFILVRVYAQHYPLAAACGRFLVHSIKACVSDADGDVEGLIRLVNFQMLSNQQNKIASMYPMLIEAVLGELPMLQDVDVYLTFLDTVETDAEMKDVLLNILTEAVFQTYSGHSSYMRKCAPAGKVDKDRCALLTVHLLAALPRLIELYSLDALHPLLLVIQKYKRQTEQDVDHSIAA